MDGKKFLRPLCARCQRHHVFRSDLTLCSECRRLLVCKVCRGPLGPGTKQRWCSACRKGLKSFERVMKTFPGIRPPAELLEELIAHYARLAAEGRPLFALTNPWE